MKCKKTVYPPLYYGPRHLVVLRAYCDESYDKDNRVYVVAGFVGRDKDWRTVSRNWRNRCLKDGIECYHASDCESQLGDFKNFTVAQSISLNSDLIEDLVGSRIAGFGVGIFVDDYKAVAETNTRAKDMLRRSPYFLALQFLLVDLAAEIATYGNSPVAFIFEQQDEFSSQVKLMYDEIKLKNPESAQCMGSLTYAPKEKFTPLQLADKLAYEVMKNILNTKYDPSRAERKSLAKMKEARVIQILRYLDFNTIEKLVLAQPL